MTKEETYQWLKQITGRKIKKGYWDKDHHTIPTGKWRGASHLNPHYWTFWAIDEDGNRAWYYVSEGFEENKDGNRWELAEEPIAEYIRSLEND